MPNADPRAETLLRPLAELAPGAALLWYDGGTSGIAISGVRATGQTPEISENDLWHVGSNTKSMTAVLVARLHEAKLLSREATVGALLGPHLAAMHPGHADTSFADLLSHRAGLPTNPTLAQLLRHQGSDEKRNSRADRQTIVSEMLAQPPEYKKFHYSNSGYLVAAAMIEMSLDQSWEALMHDHVFKPLKLDSAGFGPPGQPGVPDQPRGHKARLFRGWKALEPSPRSDNIPAFGPAGRVHMSLQDLMRYLLAHMQRESAFLSQDGWNWLHIPQNDDGYAAGWAIAEERHFHTGSNTLWHVFMGFDPARDMALIVAANAFGPEIAAASENTARNFFDD